MVVALFVSSFKQVASVFVCSLFCWKNGGIGLTPYRSGGGLTTWISDVIVMEAALPACSI
jgi:hypothetical protein